MGDVERALKKLEEKEKDIQKMLELERSIVMETGKAINAFTSFSPSGKEHVEKAEELFFNFLKPFPYREEVKVSVEGEIVEAKVVGRELLSLSFSLSFHSPEAIVYGTLDAVGELKRAFLKKAISGDVEGAKEILGKMETLLSPLERVVFSNASLPGFRRKRDAARYALETAMEVMARLSH